MKEPLEQDFTKGSLAFYTDGKQVLIYGTPSGLGRLADLCQQLVRSFNGKDTEHLHLEDYQLLTPLSHVAVVAVFPDPPIGSS